MTEDKEMSESLNKFLASVFTQEDTSNIPVWGQETNIKIENVVFTPGMIREKIKGLKTNSASGPDGISAQLLQNAREELLEPLKLIFEKTLNTGTVLQDWRHAIVTPVKDSLFT